MTPDAYRIALTAKLSELRDPKCETVLNGGGKIEQRLYDHLTGQIFALTQAIDIATAVYREMFVEEKVASAVAPDADPEETSEGDGLYG